MLWFALWSVLVLGTGVGAFFLFRRVYRSAKALVTELGRAEELLTRLDARTAELTEQAAAAHPVLPVDLTDPEPARRRRALARAATERRRAASRAAALRRWAALSR